MDKRKLLIGGSIALVVIVIIVVIIMYVRKKATALPDTITDIPNPGNSFAPGQTTPAGTITRGRSPLYDRKAIKGSGPAIYFVSNGQKTWVRSPTALVALGFNFSDVITVSDTVLNSIPSSPDSTNP